MLTFKNLPTNKEIRACVEKHSKSVDYVRVWLKDNTSKVFYNTDYQVIQVYNRRLRQSCYEIRFFNPNLISPGSFGRLGIIRSKRVFYYEKNLKEEK